MEGIPDITQERIALVICDLQPDLLGSLQHKDQYLSALEIIVALARKQSWSIVYSGLRFESGYKGVPLNHKLYGALVKLNAKLSDKAVHWFMDGYDGQSLLCTNDKIAPRESDHIVWRSQHVPYEMVALLKEQSINKVYVVGAKASVSVQIACQVLMDTGIEVCIIKECVADDNAERLQAALDHLLPIFGSVITIPELMEVWGGSLSSESQHNYTNLLSSDPNETAEEGKQKMLLASDCGRRGHGSRYMQLLMERGGWKMYPTQIWYEDLFKGQSYKCPVGKKLVDFCDEPEFSMVSMFLRGRENLDDKENVIAFAGSYMPKSYCIENGNWLGDEEPPSDDQAGALDAPWFIKESDKNLGGEAIAIVIKPSEIMQHVQKDQRYVIQQHIRNPLLTDDGRKTHLKFYVLLVCEEDGVTWTMYTYRGALLSISDVPWDPTDLSHDTQVTIHRHPQHPSETEGWKQHWPRVYERAKQGTAQIIESAIKSGKLKGRSNKKQFEVFSCDWMPDVDGNMWMFEFNMSPAVSQQEFDDDSKRDARREYLMKHDENMLREALAIVFPLGSSKKETDGEWEIAGNFSSHSTLQCLLNQYCDEEVLPIYPPNRVPISVKVSSDTSALVDDALVDIWTQEDTDSCLNGMPYDTYLGLKLYHTNPIDMISTACTSSGKLFVDYEFLVHERAEVMVNGEPVTPGIITQLNAEYFLQSGEQMRKSRIQHFTDRARRNADGSSKWMWVRGSNMSGRKLFASDLTSCCPQNVIQGKVGNCGFCSGFASLAAQFHLVLMGALGSTTTETATGAFSVRLYPEGKTRYLLLDDYVLCTTGTHSSPALSSLKENDLWIRLLEKTFVKLQSSYASLDGYYKFNSLYRHPARAIQLITGAPIAVELHYTPKQADEVYKTLLATEGKCCRVAHGRKAVDGLFKGHGYSLLWIGTIANIKLVVVRNPHGNKSYTGEFGRGSNSWETNDAVAVRKILDQQIDGNNSLVYVQSLLSEAEDNGIFLMRFSFFVECFPICSVIGPITEQRSVSAQLPVKNCLYKLQGDNISRLPEMLDAARD